jgi:prepilin-type N-terminal cleavage/methylation domain-containing protein
MAGLPWDNATRLFFGKPKNQEAQMMQKDKGLTILELMAVIGILAILATYVAPNFMSWRRNAALRGAANNLKGDLELAKARAIRENDFVAIIFRDATHYEIFLDNGAGIDGVEQNWIWDGAEPLLRNREMPGDVTIDVADTSFGPLGAKTRFNGRGHCTPGHTIVQHANGRKFEVKVNRLGLITLERQES